MSQSPAAWPEFHQRAYVVSGGSRGLGAAVADALARNGARVAIVGRDAEALGRAARDIASRHSGEPLAIAADVANPADCRRIVDTAAAAFGALDGVVNNAAHFELAPLREVGAELAAKMLDINFKGPLFLAQAYAEVAFSQKRSGAVVNVSSIAGRRPAPGCGLYSASKAALDSLTQTMALEWAPLGVRVNGVAPGHILTPGVLDDFAAGRLDRERMSKAIPRRRIAEPEEIAETILFLLSDRSVKLSFVDSTPSISTVEIGVLVETSPGVSTAPLASMIWAPGGGETDAPTATILPFSMTTVPDAISPAGPME